MENRTTATNEDLNQFLQEGMKTYPAACVALSEFRRQVRQKIQGVLADFEPQLIEVGIPHVDLRLDGAKLDVEDLSETAAILQMQKDFGKGLWFGCGVELDLERPATEQAWVFIWAYVAKRPDRDQLFRKITAQTPKHPSLDFEQASNGSSLLSMYIDPNRFHAFDETLRILLEESLAVLREVGGLHPYLQGPVTPLAEA